ncbi:MAG: hypothetical protein AAF587_21875 [Bacteroidota bacterium]
MRQLLKVFRILSIDVVLGALASGGLVVWWLEQPMPLVWWIALPLSVWVIYTADHLMDAYRLKDQAHTDRHLFHHRYFRLLFVAWLIGMSICVFLIPVFLTSQIWLFGMGMGILVIGHLSLVSIVGDRISWFFHKELGVGVIYACGIWGAPALFARVFSTPDLWIPFVQFLILALINLFVFSAYEAKTDELDGHTSFVRAIGVRNTTYLVTSLAMVVLLLGVCLSFQPMEAKRFLVLQMIYLCMLTVLVMIHFFPQWFVGEEKYRAWGDAVFIFPGIVWII